MVLTIKCHLVPLPVTGDPRLGVIPPSIKPDLFLQRKNYDAAS